MISSLPFGLLFLVGDRLSRSLSFRCDGQCNVYSDGLYLPNGERLRLVCLILFYFGA